MFFSTSVAVVTLLASTAMAIPMAGHQHQHLHAKRQGSTFNIKVKNECSSSQSIGLFQITPEFTVNSMSSAIDLASGHSTNVAAPYTALGMRLSAQADQGTGNQFNPQTLFEFGYSEYAGQDGTAYNLSLMEGSELGISVVPSNSQCETKSCPDPATCAPSQGWTDPSQETAGSPADTTCYYGQTDFVVTFCPSS